MNKIKILNYLKSFGQEHLINFFDELNFKERKILLNEIKKTNFGFMNELYKNSFFDEKIDMNKISNLRCISNLNEENKLLYKNAGENLVKNGNYAIVIMAGGNASRLGIDIPKGCLELNIKNKKISLFELFISQLKNIRKDFGVFINIYIMTSDSNYAKTINYFEQNNYFNYPKKYIKFFIQENLPILDKDGKILLKNKYHILYGPNGNGDVFNSLKKSKLIKDMEKKNIKFVLFSTVDNALTKLIDFQFIGATICNNYDVSTKTLFKEDENSKDWVFCKYNNKPYMLPSLYINLDISNKKDKENNFLFRDTNITYHLVSLEEIKKLSKIKLKYHRAYKKNDYMNLEGKIIKSDIPNSFKFEKFIFDAFYYCNDMLLYRIQKNEFCPIKNKNDISKFETINKTIEYKIDK